MLVQVLERVFIISICITIVCVLARTRLRFYFVIFLFFMGLWFFPLDAIILHRLHVPVRMKRFAVREGRFVC